MSDRVLRQATTPAGDPGVDRRGADPDQPGQVAPGERDQLIVVALQVVHLAGASDRGPQQGEAGRCSGPLLRRDGDRLHGEPLGAADEQPAARRRRDIAEGQRHDRHAGGVDLGQLGRRVAATDRSSAAALTAGVATITASASSSVASGTGPQSSANPVPRRRIERTVTPVRTSKLPLAASASGSRASPPGSDTNTGPGTAIGGVADAWAARHQRGRTAAQRRGQRRQGRRQRQGVGAPGIDTTEQRFDQPIEDLVTEPVANKRADGHIALEWPERRVARLSLDPGERCRAEYARCLQGPEVAGDSHHRSGRQRVVRTARPDLRREGERRDQLIVEAQRLDQLEPFGPASQ